MSQVRHLEMPALEAALDVIRSSPKDAGHVELIVRRPAVDQREVLSEALLDRDDGLVGDSWRARGNGSLHRTLRSVYPRAAPAGSLTTHAEPHRTETWHGRW